MKNSKLIVFALLLQVLTKATFANQVSVEIKWNPLAAINLFRPTLEGNVELVVMERIGFGASYGHNYLHLISDANYDTSYFNDFGNNYNFGVRFYLNEFGRNLILRGYIFGSYERMYDRTNIYHESRDETFGKIEKDLFFGVGYGHKFSLRNIKRLIFEASIVTGVSRESRDIINSEEFSIKKYNDDWANALWGYYAFDRTTLRVLFAIRVGFRLFPFVSEHI